MNKASIGIAGTPDHRSGFQPLIDIDYPLDLTAEPCFDVSPSEDFLIELKHTEAYVSLLYYARPDTVHSHGRERPGRLSIGLTIPRGWRFSDGVSPYTVLMDVLDTFRRLYMSPREDGSYEFKPATYMREPFDDLLENRYPLEDFPGRYVEMRGEKQAVICPVDDDEMARFFIDTQYPEFAELGSVLVSPDPLRTDTFVVEIPRPIYYDVFCSGKRYAVLTSPDQPFDRTIAPTDDFHDSVRIKFTLSGLRKGECSAFAKVDEAREEIHLYPIFPNRDFRVEFDFRPSSGTLADMQCDPKLFDLVASGSQIKELQWDEGKCYATFVGMEASEHWALRYDCGTYEPRFKYVMTSLNPKEGGTAVVALTPYAAFQGIKFSGARCLKENAYLEITFGNGDVFRRPVFRDGEIVKLPGRKEMDIAKISIVSDRYSYPELNRSYDPVTGWISVLLSSGPILREVISSVSLSSSGAVPERSRKLLKINHWWFIGWLLLALLAGIGSCLAWQRFNQPKLESQSKGNALEDVKNRHREKAGSEAEEGVSTEEGSDVGQDVNDSQVTESDPARSTNTYVLPAEDAAKLEPYVYLMKNLQSPSGEPLTFEQVKSIQRWQTGISNAAGNKDLGPNFNFIKKYIGQFSRAVDEINRIKSGAYRGKGWTVEDYYTNCKELIKVSSNCPGNDLRPFRIAIRNLAIMEPEELTNTQKYNFIHRAVLSSAPSDVNILADVNSFKGISEKYNTL